MKKSTRGKYIQDQRDFLEDILDSLDDPFYVIDVRDYSVVLANKAARQLGIQKASACFALTHKRDKPCEGEEHPCPLQHVVSKKESFTVEHVHYGAGGTPYFAEVHGYPLRNESGEVEYMVEYSVNITEKRKTEGELLNLMHALQFSASAVVITNPHGIIEYVNPAFTNITGYEHDEIIGHTPRLLKSGLHNGNFYSALWDTILRGDVWRGEIINRKKNGDIYWEYQTIAPVRDNRGTLTHFVSVKEDITTRKLVEQELERLATTDALTELPNRRTFFARGQDVFARSSHPRGKLCAIMLDIDNFKKINDLYGHAAGDEVLREVAQRLRDSLRPTDVSGRYGGEEFALLLPRVTIKELTVVAERLRKAIGEKPFVVDKKKAKVTVSLGLACKDKTVDNLEELLRRADTAMYAAKNNGRNCWSVWKAKKNAREA